MASWPTILGSKLARTPSWAGKMASPAKMAPSQPEWRSGHGHNNTSAKNCYLPGHYIFPFAGKFLFASINSLWKSGGCVCLLVTFGCYCMLHGQQPGSSGRLRFGYWWAVQSNSSSTLRALISSNRSASGRPIAGFAFSQVPSATNSMRLSARSPWRHRKQRSAKRSTVMIASPV